MNISILKQANLPSPKESLIANVYLAEAVTHNEVSNFVSTASKFGLAQPCPVHVFVRVQLFSSGYLSVMTVIVIRIISLPGQAGLVDVGLFVLGC